MGTITLQIKKPDDTSDYFPEVIISSDMITYTRSKNLHLERNTIDPVHSTLVAFWKNLFSKSYNIQLSLGEPMLLYIETLPIVIERKSTRYYLNGKSESLATLSNALARVAFSAVREKNASSLLKTLMKTLTLSENVKYCLENKVPFHFYDNFTKIEVRLNIQQISEKECAIEISDGVWANISNRNLDSFCTFFRTNKKMGKYKFMGIKKLYISLLGKSPNASQLEHMREFLKQNRQQDIVENRAVKLLQEMEEQYSDRLKLKMEDGIPVCLLVKGKGYDWKLSNSEFKSDIQKVSTYVCQPILRSDEEGNPLPLDKCQWRWIGPICIDNMSKGSSLGDQFAARAFALLNDTMTIKMVNTIKRYLIAPENTNRKDFDEMLRMQKK